MDVIEGIARLDWNDHPIGIEGKSMPLSVRNLALIFESLPTISNEAIEDFLRLRERHARRYFKAVKLIIPWLMKFRPNSLIIEMDNTQPKASPRTKASTHDWEDCDDTNTPSAEVLDKLHYDLRTFTQFKSAEEYELELSTPDQAAIIQLPQRQEHPMKARVLQMLRDGAQIKPISRETKVDPKTIRKWRTEATEFETSQAA